jgi:hypothetical protein
MQRPGICFKKKKSTVTNQHTKKSSFSKTMVTPVLADLIFCIFPKEDVKNHRNAKDETKDDDYRLPQTFDLS